MRHRLFAQLSLLLITLGASVASFAAFDPFVVRDFRVEGAQRIAEGTIYTNFPKTNAIPSTISANRKRAAL
jgi:outer membrane protein assembly factor BamA